MTFSFGEALPDEPGGYANFNALFGSVNVAPAICKGASPAACDAHGNVLDINGNVIAGGGARKQERRRQSGSLSRCPRYP